MKLDILVIAVHPDDAELGCGGTLIKHADLGYKTGIIDLTEGELGTRGSREIRRQEADAAAAIMGLTVRENMKFRDGWFRDDEEHRLALIKKVRHYQPEILITNAPDDRHPDHGRSSELTYAAAWLAGLSKIETLDENGNPQKAWRPKKIYHFIQALPLKADFVVDIKGYLPRKMEAVLAYRSQFYDPESKEEGTFIATPEFLDAVRSRVYSEGNAALIAEGEGFISKFRPAVKDLFHLV